jgi:hypothetical protein
MIGAEGSGFRFGGAGFTGYLLVPVLEVLEHPHPASHHPPCRPPLHPRGEAAGLQG